MFWGFFVSNHILNAQFIYYFHQKFESLLIWENLEYAGKVKKT
jgi:hypothetical protein